MTTELIEKLEAKWKPSAIQVGSPLVRLDEVIAIVREYEAKPVTDIEISNMLHRLNLDRSDLAALPEGSTIACNITTLRQAAELIKRLAARAVSEVAGDSLYAALDAILERYDLRKRP